MPLQLGRGHGLGILSSSLSSSGSNPHRVLDVDQHSSTSISSAIHSFRQRQWLHNNGENNYDFQHGKRKEKDIHDFSGLNHQDGVSARSYHKENNYGGRNMNWNFPEEAKIPESPHHHGKHGVRNNFDSRPDESNNSHLPNNLNVRRRFLQRAKQDEIQMLAPRTEDLDKRRKLHSGESTTMSECDRLSFTSMKASSDPFRDQSYLQISGGHHNESNQPTSRDTEAINNMPNLTSSLLAELRHRQEQEAEELFRQKETAELLLQREVLLRKQQDSNLLLGHTTTSGNNYLNALRQLEIRNEMLLRQNSSQFLSGTNALQHQHRQPSFSNPQLSTEGGSARDLLVSSAQGGSTNHQQYLASEIMSPLNRDFSLLVSPSSSFLGSTAFGQQERALLIDKHLEWQRLHQEEELMLSSRSMASAPSSLLSPLSANGANPQGILLERSLAAAAAARNPSVGGDHTTARQPAMIPGAVGDAASARLFLNNFTRTSGLPLRTTGERGLSTALGTLNTTAINEQSLHDIIANSRMGGIRTPSSSSSLSNIVSTSARMAPSVDRGVSNHDLSSVMYEHSNQTAAAMALSEQASRQRSANNQAMLKSLDERHQVLEQQLQDAKSGMTARSIGNNTKLSNNLSNNGTSGESSRHRAKINERGGVLPSTSSSTTAKRRLETTATQIRRKTNITRMDHDQEAYTKQSSSQEKSNSNHSSSLVKSASGFQKLDERKERRNGVGNDSPNQSSQETHYVHHPFSSPSSEEQTVSHTNQTNNTPSIITTSSLLHSEQGDEKVKHHQDHRFSSTYNAEKDEEGKITKV